MIHSSLAYQSDTIFAPSTAIGGAIAVVRISGPDVPRVCAALLNKRLASRMLTYAKLTYAGERIDDCMAVLFPAPNSYTGEDMLELHCHGGLQTFRRVSEALTALNLRPAEGGEFTKRAFLNGKMDLTQAEAVMDVINAQADSALRSALHQLGGGIGKRVSAIEEMLLDARSAIEAAIDYPDEMEEEVLGSLPDRLHVIEAEIESLLGSAKQGRYLREGIRAVLLGKPNVGKSSLFNALLGEDRAIVTRVAGTTRDLLDERAEWEGVSVRLMDTAGLREAADEAESIGIDRTKKALQYADLLLIVLDGSAPLTDEDFALLADTQGMKRLLIRNKADRSLSEENNAVFAASESVAVSCLTGEGIEALQKRIVSEMGALHADTTGITNVRHIRALERALSCIRGALETDELDCAATELREASHELGTITGSDVDESLLDRIFENFCVGK